MNLLPIKIIIKSTTSHLKSRCFREGNEHKWKAPDSTGVRQAATFGCGQTSQGDATAQSPPVPLSPRELGEWEQSQVAWTEVELGEGRGAFCRRWGLQPALHGADRT